MADESTNNTPAPEGGAPASGALPTKTVQVPMSTAELAEYYRKLAEAEKAKEQPEEEKEEDENAPEAEAQDQEQEEPESDEQPSRGNGYTLEVPDEVPENFREEIAVHVEAVGQLAKSVGVAQETVQDLVNYAVGLESSSEAKTDMAIIRAHMEAGQAEGDTTQAQQIGETMLRNRYGEKAANKIITEARAAVQRLGPKVADFLDRTGYGNAPAVLAALAAYQRGELHLSPEAAAAELTRLKGTKAFLSGDRTVRDRIQLLYMRSSRQSTVESQPRAAAKKTDASISRASALDAEIKKLTRHEAFLKPDHKDHKAVRARLNTLYEARYPGFEDGDES